MISLPAKTGPIKQPKPLNKFTIPFAFGNFFKPTISHKYIVVKQFMPASNGKKEKRFFKPSSTVKYIDFQK